jgi:hypothetical protein
MGFCGFGYRYFTVSFFLWLFWMEWKITGFYACFIKKNKNIVQNKLDHIVDININSFNIKIKLIFTTVWIKKYQLNIFLYRIPFTIISEAAHRHTWIHDPVASFAGHVPVRIPHGS